MSDVDKHHLYNEEIMTTVNTAEEAINNANVCDINLRRLLINHGCNQYVVNCLFDEDFFLDESQQKLYGEVEIKRRTESMQQPSGQQSSKKRSRPTKMRGIVI